MYVIMSLCCSVEFRGKRVDMLHMLFASFSPCRYKKWNKKKQTVYFFTSSWQHIPVKEAEAVTKLFL